MVENTSVPERVQASFRQLSASATSLNTVSDELRKTIFELETVLKGLNLGVSAWVTMARGGDSSGYGYWSRGVGYTRIAGDWSIALKTVTGDERAPEDEDEEIWAFNDAPRWLRVEAIGKIPELLDALTKQADDTAAKIKNKTAEAKALTEAIKLVVKQPKESPRK